MAHTVMVAPIAPVAIAVPRSPPEAIRPRLIGSLASRPSIRFITPVSASLTALDHPHWAAETPTVVDRSWEVPQW